MKKTRGFTLIEVMMAVGITVIIFLALANFAKDTLVLHRDAFDSMNARLSAHKTLGALVKELRGAEALYSVSTSSISFYLDGGLEERELLSGAFSYTEPVLTISLTEGGREYRTTVTLRNLIDHE